MKSHLHLDKLDRLLLKYLDSLIEMKNRHLYPENWKEISLAVRTNADWKCQKCGKPCRRTGQSINDFLDEHHELDAIAVHSNPIRWCLTVAHLNHTPSDCSLENLMAMCAPCHLKYDAVHHQRSRKTNRKKELEKHGQLVLF